MQRKLFLRNRNAVKVGASQRCSRRERLADDASNAVARGDLPHAQRLLVIDVQRMEGAELIDWAEALGQVASVSLGAIVSVRRGFFAKHGWQCLFCLGGSAMPRSAN
jgi:hypothetical protein